MYYTFDEENLLRLLEEIQEDALNADGNFYDTHFQTREDLIDEVKCWCEEEK